MPSLRRDRGNGWWGRVIVDGRQVACRMFPPGRKKGPEWTAAKSWEVETKGKIEVMLTQGLTILDALEKLGLEASPQLRQEMPERRTPTGLERLFGWGDDYLAHVERTMKRQTMVEKKTVLKAFFAFCKAEGIGRPEDVTRPRVYAFLARIADEKGPHRANVYRKNILAAWNWGIDFVDDFPQSSAVIERIRPFPAKRGQRYVPPEEDVIKVLQLATGQDLVFLLTMYYTGARRGELFRLSWGDIDLVGERIRLTDHKTRNGSERERWLTLHPELSKALNWWKRARPCKVDNVFMQTQSESFMGQPYRQRIHFMNTLCDRARAVHT